MKFEKLFRPGRIGELRLKNRIVMPPMATMLCGEWGEVTDRLVNWYSRRAEGGAGLIVVETCMTATAVDPIRLLPCVLRADDDCYGPGLARLVEGVHENGSKIGIQLSPGAGAQASGGPWMPGTNAIQKVLAVSPSGVPAYGTEKKARFLTTEEVEEIVKLCGDSARRIKQTGFDLIEIHAHGGYLIAQFLSAYFNKRTDKYGGNLENRFRFLMEIVRSMRKAVGSGFPLIVKYSIDEYIEGGRGVEESQVLATKLEEAGIDGISISSGVYGARVPAVPPYYFQRGILLPLAEAIKEKVKIPVVAVGRLDDAELAEKILEDGKADFIGLGRALIADPDWPLKTAGTISGTIRKCIACNECRETLFKLAALRCAVNPIAGREGKYALIRAAEVQKRVVIVGAGPAGMETARVAALKGHKVVLFEGGGEMGGALKVASIPSHKEILNSIPEYYSETLKELGVGIRLNTRATAELIMKETPDAVVIASGGGHRIPDIPGIDKDLVTTATDVLSGKQKTGYKVIVAGGGSIGCETANYLATDKKEVVIVEMLDTVGADMERWIWNALSSELADRNVEILTSMKIIEITDEGVVLVNKNWEKSFHKADTVVLAVGFSPLDTLSGELAGKVEEVYTIGDASFPRRIIDAIYEGFKTAYNL